MTETERALDMLAGLNADDRNWIVQHLSAGAKSRLMDSRPAEKREPTASASAASVAGSVGAAAGSSAATSANVAAAASTAAAPGRTTAPDSRVIERLCAADPERIGFLLHSEPAWLVCALLRAHAWPWRKQLLQSLPVSTRAEIARLERHGTALARPALEALLSDLAESAGPPMHTAAPASGFEAVLLRLRRSRAP